MKKLILGLILASSFAFAQYPVTASRITRGAGAPSTGCSFAADRGKVYIRTDAAAASSSLYACVNTTGSTTAWELQSGAAALGYTPFNVANNLSEGVAATMRTNLGLGTAALISSTAGGDLSGTLPSPSVAKVNGQTPGGTCTTQFARSIDSSGRPTCASIANADLPTLTYTPSIFGSANLIPDSSGNVFAEPFTVLSASAFFAYQVMAFADTSTSDCMFTRWNVPINYTTGGTNFIVDWNTTATSGNAIWTVDYRDVSTATLAATTAQESLTVTTAASGTASARTQSSLAATAANFSAGDVVQIKVCRNGAGSDTIAATLAIHDIRFSYVGRP